MIKIENVEGILWCDKDGNRDVMKIEKCDVVFVFAFSDDKDGVNAQVVTIGGMSAGSTIKALARAAADRMSCFFGDPSKDFGAMHEFEKEFHSCTLEFMQKHLFEILSEKGGEWTCTVTNATDAEHQ